MARIDGQVYRVAVRGGAVYVDGALLAERVEADASGQVLLHAAGAPVAVFVEEGGMGAVVRGRRFGIELLDDKALLREAAAGGAEGRAPAAVVHAPMPGLVLGVLVEAGQTVEAGQPVVVLEAMKMENELRAPAAGAVEAVHVREGDTVAKGALLLKLRT